MNIHLKNLGFLLFSGIFAACGNSQNSSNIDNVTPVWVEEVTPRTIEEYVTATGTAKAMKTASIATESVGNYILQKNPRTGKPYKLGDKVNSGDVIIRLDNKKYENEIQYESKKLQVDIDEKEWEGQSKLFEKGGATQKEVNTAYSSYINAKLSFENAQIELGKMSIRAPFSGVIVSLPYYTPNVELASGTTVVEIMDYSKMYVETQFPESSLENLHENLPVYISNYNSDTRQNGKLTQLSPAINEDTRTFSGYISIENPDLKLRPGMFVKAEIVTARSENVLAVPKEIITTRRGNDIVFIVESANAVQKEIKTGISDDSYIEIKEGLEEGDQIIVKGYEWLRDHSKITVRK